MTTAIPCVVARKSIYKRCDSNKILVVYRKQNIDYVVLKCIHGGGVFVIPFIQKYTTLSLDPITTSINFNDIACKKDEKISTSADFTFAISYALTTDQAKGLMGLDKDQIISMAKGVIIPRFKSVIAKFDVIEIEQNRTRLLDLLDFSIKMELEKIGLLSININLKDINSEYLTDVHKYVTWTIIKLAEQEVNSGIKYNKAEYEREQKRLIRERIAQIIREKIVDANTKKM